MYLEHCFTFLGAAHAKTFHSCLSPITPIWTSMLLAISGTHPNIFERFGNSDAGEGNLYTLMYLEHCFAFLQAARTRTFHSCPSPAWASILLAISGTPDIHTIRSLERSSFRVRCLSWNIHSMPDSPQNPALHVSTLLLTFVPSMPDPYHGEMQRPQMFQNISAAFICKPLIFVTLSYCAPKVTASKVMLPTPRSMLSYS